MAKTYQSKSARKSMTFNRYMQLVYYVRDFQNLSKRDRDKIFEIAKLCVGERYAQTFLRAQIEKMPYKSIDIPYSSRAYTNIRAKFFRKLDEALKNKSK